MSDSPNTQNVQIDDETVEVAVVERSFTLNSKIAKIAVASFTAGAAVAALILKIREGAFSDDTVDVYASEDTLTVTETQD